MKKTCLSVMASAVVLAFVGCETDDARLVEATREADRRQAEQNQLIAQQNQQLVGATRQLVKADAKARQELIAAHSALEGQLQDERGNLDRQHDELEAERRQIAAQRYRDPILAQAIVQISLLATCVLPIIVCLFLARGLRDQATNADLQAILVKELVSDAPTLLGTSHRTQLALTASSPPPGSTSTSD